MKKKIITKVIEETGCLIPINRVPNKGGYFVTNKNGKYDYLHREIALKKYKINKIPPRRVVMHTCDNPSCVNPDHLLIGTMKDNSQDSVKKNRSARGERSGLTSLRETDAIAICLINTLTLKELSKMFNVTVDVIKQIKSKTTWKHLTVKRIPCKSHTFKNKMKKNGVYEEHIKVIKDLKGIRKAKDIAFSYGITTRDVFYIWRHL